MKSDGSVPQDPHALQNFLRTGNISSDDDVIFKDDDDDDDSGNNDHGDTNLQYSTTEHTSSYRTGVFSIDTTIEHLVRAAELEQQQQIEQQQQEQEQKEGSSTDGDGSAYNMVDDNNSNSFDEAMIELQQQRSFIGRGEDNTEDVVERIRQERPLSEDRIGSDSSSSSSWQSATISSLSLIHI